MKIWNDSWPLKQKNKPIPPPLDTSQLTNSLILTCKTATHHILITTDWPVFSVSNLLTSSTLIKESVSHVTVIKFTSKIFTSVNQERKSEFLKNLIDYLPLPKLQLLSTNNHSSKPSTTILKQSFILVNKQINTAILLTVSLAEMANILTLKLSNVSDVTVFTSITIKLVKPKFIFSQIWKRLKL